MGQNDLRLEVAGVLGSARDRKAKPALHHCFGLIGHAPGAERGPSAFVGFYERALPG